MDPVKNINRLAYWTALAASPQWGGYACVWRPNAEVCYVALGVDEVKSGDELSTLDTIQHAGRYWFGFLSYDLKNRIEKLTTTRPHPMSFPGLLFFSPKLLVRIEQGKEEVIVDLTDGHWKNEKVTIEGIELHKAFDWKLMQSRESYLEAVRQLKEHIQQGDIYEVNYCTAFETEAIIDHPFALFNVLNERTEAPYATFFSWPGRTVL
jgi:para-aminobenzoate synthetase component 1